MTTTSEGCGWFCFFGGNELKLAEGAAGPRADIRQFFEEEKGKAVTGEEEEREEGEEI